MTKEEGLFIGVVMALFAVLFLYLFLRIKSMQQHLDRLDTCTYECVSEMRFRLEQDQRRELDRKVDAMQEHLGLVTFQQPSRTVVVKKGNAS